MALKMEQKNDLDFILRNLLAGGKFIELCYRLKIKTLSHAYQIKYLLK